MARYQLTPQDRAKGGKSTATRHNMRERGKTGLESLARRYFDGDLTRASKALSRIGNWWTDPCPWNGAFQLPDDLPTELRAKLYSKRFGISTGGETFPENPLESPEIAF